MSDCGDCDCGDCGDCGDCNSCCGGEGCCEGDADCCECCSDLCDCNCTIFNCLTVYCDLLSCCGDDDGCCEKKKETSENVQDNNVDQDYRGNNASNGLEHYRSNCRADIEPVIDQPRFEPNSSPINHHDIGRAESGIINHGICSAAKNSSDHSDVPPSYEEATSVHCIVHGVSGNSGVNQGSAIS